MTESKGHALSPLRFTSNRFKKEPLLIVKYYCHILHVDMSSCQANFYIYTVS